MILATHNLDEAEQLCDRLAIIAQGRLKALGSVGQLRSVFQKQEKCELQVKNLSEAVLLQLGSIDGVIDCLPATKNNGTQSIELRISDRAVVLPQLMNTMVKSGVEVCDCQLTELPLDEIFLHALRSDN